MTGYRWLFAVAGVAVSLFFSLERMGIINGSVVLTYVTATMFTGSLVAYIFCALPFATAFCEDIENKYIYYQVTRSSLMEYTASRVIVIFCSSVMTMIAGTLVFVTLCRTQSPWVQAEGADGFLLAGSYARLLEEGHYLAYCMMYAFQLGLLAGVLSVLSAFLSLYLSNRVMVLILPVFFMQILANFRIDGGFSILSYRVYNRFFGEDWQCALFLTMISVGIAICLAYGIYRKLKKRL